MHLLLFPFALVAALIVAVLVLFAATGAWPLLLIAAGIWLLTRQGDRRLSPNTASPGWRRHADGRPRGYRQQVPPQAAPSRQSPDAPARAASGPSLPPDLQQKAERIRQKADGLLAQADRFPPYSPDLYLVRQTAADYLPRTIRAYLSLPAGAADRVVDGTSKTAHQELGEQLDLLSAKLEDIAEHLHARDLDPLLANRQFLEDRFSNAGDAAPPEANPAP